MRFRLYHIFAFVLLPFMLLAEGELVDSTSNFRALQKQVDALVESGLRAKAYPGCQVLVLKDGVSLINKSYGWLDYEQTASVTDSTCYDLASLTKVAGTLLAVMKLFDEGRLALDAPVSGFLPEFTGTDKAAITLRSLLLHETGFPASLNAVALVTTKDTAHRVRIGSTNYIDSLISKRPGSAFALQVSDSLWLRSDVHRMALERIARMKLGKPVYLYSCINFILLKEVVEAVSGKPLDVYLDSVFYKPMGLRETAFLPLRWISKERIAPTLCRDFLRNDRVQGYVQDPDAALLGGVSGNAGLFSSARDVAEICQLILNGGVLNGRRYLSEACCSLFTTTTSALKRRWLGFDRSIPSNPTHSPCSPSTPASVYGHTGYTGTCCWVDPDNKLVFVFLSNRTYPNDAANKLVKMGIRTNIQEALYHYLKKQ